MYVDQPVHETTLMKSQSVEPNPNEYIYKTLPNLTLREYHGRWVRKVVRARGSEILLTIILVIFFLFGMFIVMYHIAAFVNGSIFKRVAL